MKRKGIMMRWILNCLGVMTIFLLVVLIIVSLSIKQFYYNNVKQILSSNITAVANQLEKAYNNYPSSFPSEIRSTVEEWTAKNQMELMAINSKGAVVLTSSGFTPTFMQDMEDYNIALESGTEGYSTHKLPSGERCMAVTILLTENIYGYSAVRLVTSMTNIDNQIKFVIICIAVLIALVIFLVCISGLYFVNSIIMPLKDLEDTARKYTKGDFSARNVKKANDEIGELSDIFNKMAEELSQSEDMKNEFISSVSHELRTPLTAIKGWSETIASMSDDSAAVAKGMAVIGNETDRLSQMVEELLDFSRIQSGRFTLNKDTIDILAELGDAVLIYKQKAKKDNISIIYNEPDMLPFVYGDKNRLRQVFINVIDNAIKYSDPGGLVSINATMRDATHIQIDVSDKGCGISAEDLPKIKTKFYKANHTRRGSGIGLAVADEIITMHDGILNIYSEQGVGTTVSIIIPVKA